MKKIAMTLCCWRPAYGRRRRSAPRTRVEWGVIGGINIPDYTTNMDRTDIKNKLGWQAGIVTAVNLGAFAVEPQILYVRQGMRIRPEGGEEVNLKSNSIDVPVLLSLRLLHPVRIYAGPVFTVMNDSKQKSGRDLLDFGRVRPTMSYTVGAGVKRCATCSSICATTASLRPRRTWCCPTAAASTSSVRITSPSASVTCFSL